MHVLYPLPLKVRFCQSETPVGNSSTVLFCLVFHLLYLKWLLVNPDLRNCGPWGRLQHSWILQCRCINSAVVWFQAVAQLVLDMSPWVMGVRVPLSLFLVEVSTLKCKQGKKKLPYSVRVWSSTKKEGSVDRESAVKLCITFCRVILKMLTRDSWN